MKKLLLSTVAVTLITASSAFAQTTLPSTQPTAPAPSAVDKPIVPSLTPATPMTAPSITLTDTQAKEWVNKVVYSSDGTKLGEVAAFARDPSGKVTEMHADIGGFLGIGETRIRVMPGQFKLGQDRVDLTLTAEQAKVQPKLVK